MQTLSKSISLNRFFIINREFFANNIIAVSIITLIFFILSLNIPIYVCIGALHTIILNYTLVFGANDPFFYVSSFFNKWNQCIINSIYAVSNILLFKAIFILVISCYILDYNFSIYYLIDLSNISFNCLVLFVLVIHVIGIFYNSTNTLDIINLLVLILLGLFLNSVFFFVFGCIFSFIANSFFICYLELSDLGILKMDSGAPQGGAQGGGGAPGGPGGAGGPGVGPGPQGLHFPDDPQAEPRYDKNAILSALKKIVAKKANPELIGTNVSAQIHGLDNNLDMREIEAVVAATCEARGDKEFCLIKGSRGGGWRFC